jgi:hypothetical protein
MSMRVCMHTDRHGAAVIATVPRFVAIVYSVFARLRAAVFDRVSSRAISLHCCTLATAVPSHSSAEGKRALVTL